jgi:hypothetical protein
MKYLRAFLFYIVLFSFMLLAVFMVTIGLWILALGWWFGEWIGALNPGTDTEKRYALTRLTDTFHKYLELNPFIKDKD